MHATYLRVAVEGAGREIQHIAEQTQCRLRAMQTTIEGGEGEHERQVGARDAANEDIDSES